MNVKPQDIVREICDKYKVNLSKKSKDDLASILHPLYLIRGKNVVNAGEVNDSMYFVHQGLLFEEYTRDGIMITRRIMHEGDMVMSTESYITGAPAFQTITVFEPAMLYEIKRSDFAMISADSVEMCQLNLAIYERQIMEMDHWYYDMKYSTARQRYERLIQVDPEITLRAPMKRIASLLQMEPETLSRVRSIVHADDDD